MRPYRTLLPFAMLLLGLAACHSAAPAPDPAPAPGHDPAPAPAPNPDPAPGAPDFQCPPEDAAGRVIYVSPEGDDAAGGTRNDPLRHPARAAKQLQPGDTLVLLPGTYRLSSFAQDILRPPSGKPGRWITICGEPDGPYPVLAGENNLIAAIDLRGTEYLRIGRLEITHNPEAEDLRFRVGIRGRGAPSRHLHFYDLYIHHIDQFGIDLQDVEDLTIEHSRIEYTGYGALGGPRGEHGGWRNVTVRNASLSYGGHYYRGGDGSDRPYDRPDGLGVEPSRGPLILDRVVAMHNRGDGLDSKVEVTTITNTIVANNWGDGIKLWGREGYLENVLIYGRGDGVDRVSPWSPLVVGTRFSGARFVFKHVTVDDAYGGNYLMHVQYGNRDVPVELVWRNLIFSSRGPKAPIFLASSVVLDAEGVLFANAEERLLVWGDQTYTCGDLDALGSAVFCGNPDFIFPAWGQEGDYRLGDDSQAIDAGVDAGVATDLDGRTRDAKPDLGAYERP